MTQQNIFTANVQLSDFALQLRKYRLDNGLSSSEVATQLGVSLERVGLLEMDRERPTRLVRSRLSRLVRQKEIVPPK